MPEGIRCTFSDRQIAWLRPRSGQTTWLQVLESRREQTAPVYAELAEDLTMVALRLPRLGRPSRPREDERGDLRFEIEPWQSIHTLSRRNPDFDALRRGLEEAQARNAWLLVTSTDTHEIIHVAPRPRDFPLPAEPGAVQILALVLARWRQWLSDRILIPLRLLSTVNLPTEVDALHLFNQVSARSCVSGNWAPDCLPFLYPDNGCRARAHDMCRMILAAGFVPKKIWVVPVSAFDELVVGTRNSPTCNVSWTNHVAPLIKVITSSNTVLPYVIDPSLFGGPVPQATWVAKVTGGNPPASISVLPWHFFKKGGTTDDDFSITNKELKEERDAFLLRIGGRGFPPYC